MLFLCLLCRIGSRGTSRGAQLWLCKYTVLNRLCFLCFCHGKIWNQRSEGKVKGEGRMWETFKGLVTTFVLKLKYLFFLIQINKKICMFCKDWYSGKTLSRVYVSFSSGCDLRGVPFGPQLNRIIFSWMGVLWGRQWIWVFFFVVVVALYCHLVTSTSEISHQPAHT